MPNAFLHILNMKPTIFFIVFFLFIGKATNAISDTVINVIFISSALLIYIAWHEGKKAKQEKELRKQRMQKIKSITDAYKRPPYGR